jgi:hypothetical protein
MPSISMFFGIIVYMYAVENKQHKLPHIHVKYQGHEAVYSLVDSEKLSGDFPKKQGRMVQVWIDLHQDELLADWDIAISGQEPYKIEPLKR